MIAVLRRGRYDARVYRWCAPPVIIGHPPEEDRTVQVAPTHVNGIDTLQATWRSTACRQ